MTGIPGATGSEMHTTTSGITSSEYIVSFTKGNTAFAVVVATSSGDLPSTNGYQWLTEQFANPQTFQRAAMTNNWHLLPGVPLVGIVL